MTTPLRADDTPGDTSILGTSSDAGPISGPAPERIGSYEISEKLGQGGMGIVYRAFDRNLGRDVALKVLRPGLLGSDREVERFRLEARAMARLRHANIVTVHEVGESRSGPFFVMDYIEGETLNVRLEKKGPLAPRSAALIASKLARALAVAHAQGILHRDVKPANVLISSSGEPILTDFGLAKDLHTTERLTEHSTVVGTPAYMAPEQACGNADVIDRRADIYALGATLYQALTGSPPFEAETPMATLNRVVHEEPVPPSKRRAGIDRDLDTICLACLEKDPQDRYLSAGALAEDLELYLRDEPIAAHRPGVFDRARKWVRRNSRLARSLGVLAGAFLAAIAVGTLVFVARLRAERDRAAAARERAREALDILVAEVRDELDDVGGAHVREVRRRLLEHALATLEELGGDDPRASSRAGEAHRQIGELAFAAGDNERAARELETAVAQLREDGTAGAGESLARALIGLGRIRSARGDLAGARQALLESHDLVHDDASATDALLGLADVFKAQGHLASARSALEDALAIQRRTGAASLAPALLALAEVCRLQGELPAALAHSEEAFARSSEVLAHEPSSLRARRWSVAALVGAGDAEVDQGDHAKGQARFEEALALERKLLAEDGEDVAARGDVRDTLRRFGDMKVRQGDRRAALASYEEALAVAHALQGRDPSSVRAILGLGEILEKIADARAGLGDRQEARAAFEEAIALYDKVPGDMLVLRARARCLGRFSFLHERTGDAKRALALLEEATAIERRIVAADPSQAAAQGELVVTLGSTGEILEDGGDLGAAQRHYEEALRISTELFERDPTNARVRANRSASFIRIALLLDRRGRDDEAVSTLDRAIADYDVLAAKGEPYVATRAWLGQARAQFSRTWELVQGTRAPAGSEELLSLAHALSARGDLSRATAAFEKGLEDETRRDPALGNLYDAACTAAQASVSETGDAREAYRRRALDWIAADARARRQALRELDDKLAASRAPERGELEERRRELARRLDGLRDAPALEPLRALPEFQALLAER